MFFVRTVVRRQKAAILLELYDESIIGVLSIFWLVFFLDVPYDIPQLECADCPILFFVFGDWGNVRWDPADAFGVGTKQEEDQTVKRPVATEERPGKKNIAIDG